MYPAKLVFQSLKCYPKYCKRAYFRWVGISRYGCSFNKGGTPRIRYDTILSCGSNFHNKIPISYLFSRGWNFHEGNIARNPKNTPRENCHVYSIASSSTLRKMLEFSIRIGFQVIFLVTGQRYPSSNELH